MSDLKTLEGDAEVLFLRSAAAGKSAAWMLIGGAACILAALVGFAAAQVADVDQLRLHMMSTAPTIVGVGLLIGGWNLWSAPRQVAVGPRGIAIEGRTRRQYAWQQIGWAMVGVPGMGGRRVLSIYDTSGKSLARISDAFENFGMLVDLVSARVAARPDDATSRIQAGKSRRSAYITLGSGAALLAAAVGIALVTRSEQHAQQLLATQGVPGEGAIVRRFLAPNGVTPRLEYRPQTAGENGGVRNAEVERAYWDSLAKATTVPILVVPGRPEVSRLAQGEVRDDDFFKTPLGGYGLAIAGGLLSLLLVGVGLMQLSGWDIDLDSKTGKISIKRFGTGK